jgi:hypothetical protein
MPKDSPSRINSGKIVIMKNNLKGFLVLVFVLLALTGFAIYQVLVGQGRLLGVGLLLGVFVGIIDWLLRKPGRRPNQKVMLWAAVGGLMAPQLTRIVFGREAYEAFIAVTVGVVLPLCLYFFVATLVTAKRSPGYWQR